MINKEEWKVYGNVFSQHSRQILFHLASQGYFEELQSTVSVGKEANVFTARTKDHHVIVKIYRLENCNFNKMHDYLTTDPRYIMQSKRSRLIVFAWTQREYKNLMIARSVIKVPKPIAVKDNVLVMEFIGDEVAAPELKDARPKDPQKFFKKVIDNITKLWKKGLVHGDLSSFNILNYHEEPIFIDFSQATMVGASNAEELLRRDVKNVCVFFRKLMKISDTEEEKLYEKILKSRKAE